MCEQKRDNITYFSGGKRELLEKKSNSHYLTIGFWVLINVLKIIFQHYQALFFIESNSITDHSFESIRNNFFRVFLL